MLTYTRRNITVGLFFVSFCIVIYGFADIFSVIYELVLEFIGSLFNLIMILFEWVEFIIEGILQSVFHLSHQQTQLVAFYLFSGIALLVLIYLWYKLPGIYRKFKSNLKTEWLRQKKRISYYWQSIPLFNKVKWLTVSIVGTTGMLFFI